MIENENVNYVENNKEETIYSNHLDPAEELKFFLIEYRQFLSEKLEYYYIISSDWFKRWDYFILNPR